MPVEVVMPKFGLTMQEGTLQQWFKAEGERIETGQPLFEVETEKVLYEVPAPASGTVAKLLYAVEATVACARVVAVIAIDGEDPHAIAARYTASVATPQEDHHAAPRAGERGRLATTAVTPAARKLAKECGVDLSTITGNGPGGRITREDVEAAIATRTQAAAAVSRGVPLSGMRKVIAARMLESLQSSAQLTLTTEADVTALVARRDLLKRQFALTYTDLLIEAVAVVLRQHPRLRVTVAGDTIQLQEDINIGVAVALDEGLIVPIIHSVDKKSLQQIAAERQRLTEKARAGTLELDEVSGGTFTITNLGVYGVDAFTPIINLPQIAILGVGRVVQKPAVYDDQVSIRSMMFLSLTFDHRIVDGAPAAAFLRDLAQCVGGSAG